MTTPFAHWKVYSGLLGKTIIKPLRAWASAPALSFSLHGRAPTAFGSEAAQARKEGCARWNNLSPPNAPFPRCAIQMYYKKLFLLTTYIPRDITETHCVYDQIIG